MEATAVVFRSTTQLGFQDGECVPVREVSGFRDDRDWSGAPARGRRPRDWLTRVGPTDGGRGQTGGQCPTLPFRGGPFPRMVPTRTEW